MMQIHLRPNAPASKMVPGSAASHEGRLGEYGNWKTEKYLGRWGEIESYSASPLGASQQSDYVLHTPGDPAAEAGLALLQREWAISRQIAHSHLLPVLDAHLQRSPYFLVTPKLQGTNLRTVLDQQKTISIGRALWILRQAAEAVDALHAHGWLNPSLDTASMLLAPDGHLTMIGAGQARLQQTNEVVRGQQTYTDLCSLGGLLLEFLGFAEHHHLLEQRTHDRGSKNLFDALPPTVVDLLTWILSRKTICDQRQVHQLVQRLVRLEIQFFSLAG